MDGHRDGPIPDEALTRHEVELLATSYLVTRQLGCDCAVRFDVQRCDGPGDACAHVRTFHDDACRLALRVHAPTN